MKDQKQITDTLLEISRLLSTKVKWVLGGSSALLVHGLEVKPNDVDIVVDNQDYDKACSILKEYIISSPEIHINTRKTHYKINNISGELLMYPIDEQNIDFRDFRDKSFPVYKLEMELQFYTSREDKKEANSHKIKMINKELKQRASKDLLQT